MIDSCKEQIHIYDRQFIFNKQIKQINKFNRIYDGWYQFPSKYEGLIKGSLNYKQVLHLYKKYKCVMNTNTVTDSKTMFSRRVVEAAASSIPIISNFAIGIKYIFGDDIIFYDDKDRIIKLFNDEEYRRNLGDKLYKKTMHNYTYKHLVRNMVNNIPILKNKSIKKNHNIDKDASCFIFIENINNFDKFSYFIKNYNCNIISDTITRDILTENNINIDRRSAIIKYNQIKDIVKKNKYYVIMNEFCIYEDDYIRNSMLPTLYTDAEIIGKACYYYRFKRNIVSKSLEHKFTNRINLNTVIFRLNQNTIKFFDRNLLDNIGNYIKNKFDGKNIYSTDRFDFLDNDYKYHYIYHYPVDIQNINKIKKINKSNTDTIPIIMCCYKRINLISKIIACLNKQTDKNFSLYLWNNSPDMNDVLYKNINNSKPLFDVFCHNSKKNVGGIGRFYLIKKLSNTDYVIFIDDDQIFDKDMVYNFRKAARKKKSFNWYGRKFIKNMPYMDIGKKDRRRVCCLPVSYGNEYNYGGTGGMIIDADIFKIDEFYYSFPKEYLFVEDLWMSFYGNKYLAYKFIKIKQNIKTIRDNNDQCTEIWDIKNHLLEYCRQLGWDV